MSDGLGSSEGRDDGTPGRKDSSGSADRRDSDLEGLFKDIGLSPSSPVARSGSLASTGSLDDVDAFISNLTKNDSSDKLNAKSKDDKWNNMGDTEQDDFLNWLEDGDEEKPTRADSIDREASQLGEYIEEDDDEEDEEDEVIDFYIDDRSGALVLDQGDAENEQVDPAEEIRDEKPVFRIEAPVVTPLTEEEIQKRQEDSCPQALHEYIGDTKADMDISPFTEKVVNRVETLFDIDQCEVPALRSALTIKEIVGLVVPQTLRFDLWNAVLTGSNSLDTGAPLPEWAREDNKLYATLPNEVVSEIEKDCTMICTTNPTLKPNQGGMVTLVSRLVCRQENRCYNVLLANLVATVTFVVTTARGDRPVSEQLNICSQLLEKLCQLWTGSDGDWVRVGLTPNRDVNGKGVGGAAWANETLPLVEFRRQHLLGKLVAFHDPVLGYHLSSHYDGWDLTKKHVRENDGDEVEDMFQSKTFDRVLAMLDDFSDEDALSLPVSKCDLFGLMSICSGPKAPLPVDEVVVFWDALLLLGEPVKPQEMSFFYATAALILARDKILAQHDNTSIHKVVSKVVALHRTNKPRGIHHVVSLGELLRRNTPRKERRLLSEEELLLRISNVEAVRLFTENLIAEKKREQFLLEEYERAKRLHKRTQSNDSLSSARSDPISDESAQAAVVQEEAGTPKDSEITTAQPSNATTKAWLSNTFRKGAANFKSALKSVGESNVDWSKYDVKRRLVKFSGPEDQGLGLSFTKGSMGGIEVTKVESDGMAAASQLVYPGDLIMTLNGLLVFSLSPKDLECLLQLQERPFYMVIGTKLPKDLERDSPVPEKEAYEESRARILCERIEDYYARYNPGKEKEVKRILEIYAHREPALLQELSLKYIDHVEGDPFVLPLSMFCISIDPLDVVSQFYFGHGSPARKRKVEGRKLFVVDCRQKNIIDSTGRLPTTFMVNPSELDKPAVQTPLLSTLGQVRGEMIICILGDGSDVLLAEFNPKRARQKREEDRRAVDTCVLFFLRHGFPFVGVIEDGFFGCHRAMKKLGYQPDDCLVNISDNRMVFERYDAFLRFRRSNPARAAGFLASKARGVVHKKDKRDSTISFSGMIDEEKASQFVGKASALLSNVWKKGETGNVASKPPVPPPSQSNATPAPEKKEKPAQSGGFWGSVWKKPAATSAAEEDMGQAEKSKGAEVESPVDASDSQGQSTGWGWSSIRNFKVPEKLKTSMNQAYETAQQKITAAANDLAEAEAQNQKRTSTEYVPLDKESLDKIARFKKGDLIEFSDMGRLCRAFAVQKEKIEEKLAKPYLVKRMLLVTPERFLVLDPHPMRPGFGYVKSTRTLKEVTRLRFPNEDPSTINIFYTKEGRAEPYSTKYLFADSCKPFARYLMGHVGRYNEKFQPVVKVAKSNKQEQHASKEEEEPTKSEQQQATEEVSEEAASQKDVSKHENN